jgi:hypothetical protein
MFIQPYALILVLRIQNIFNSFHSKNHTFILLMMRKKNK